VNGALQFDEPGVLMTFEENAEEIASDVESLGFNLRDLIEKQKLAVDYVPVDRSEIALLRRSRVTRIGSAEQASRLR
jgi:circadian clock protein KaiC